MKQLKTIADLTPDPHNANRGTKRGDALLEHSLQQLGAGRSVLVDKNGILIAGNKTHAKFGEVMDGSIIVVPTNGHQLVVVQRTDLDMTSPGDDGRRARELAIADNKVGQADLDWDPEALLDAGVDLKMYFDGEELAALERKASKEWVAAGTRTEREASAVSGVSPVSPVSPAAAPAEAGPEPVKGQAPKTVHECPKCGHQW